MGKVVERAVVALISWLEATYGDGTIHKQEW